MDLRHPTNRIAVESHRTTSVETRLYITTFRVREGDDPEQVLIRVLPAVDRHHNELAQDPPYSVVSVFGTTATDEVRVALSEYGFVVSEQSCAHFLAKLRQEAGEQAS